MKRTLRAGWCCVVLAAAAIGCKSSTPSATETVPPAAASAPSTSAPVTSAPPISGAQVAYTPPAQPAAGPALPSYSVVTAASYPYTVASTDSTGAPPPAASATGPAASAPAAAEAAKPWWKKNWFSRAEKSEPELRAYEERKRSYAEAIPYTD